jgi:hypothetical protein
MELRRGVVQPVVSREKHAYHVLSYVCSRGYYRHRFKSGSYQVWGFTPSSYSDRLWSLMKKPSLPPSPIQEACDDLVDDYSKPMAALLVKAMAGQVDWDEMERTVCVDTADSCSASHYRTEL